MSRPGQAPVGLAKVLQVDVVALLSNPVSPVQPFEIF